MHYHWNGIELRRNLEKEHYVCVIHQIKCTEKQLHQCYAYMVESMTYLQIITFT